VKHASNSTPAHSEHPQTLIGHIRANALSVPGNRALVHDGQMLDWGGFARRTQAASATLAAACPGALRIGLVAPLTIDGVIAFWGIVGAGCSVVPLPLTQPIDVVRHMIADAGLRFIVATDPAEPLVRALYPTLPPVGGRGPLLLDLRGGSLLDLRGGWISALPTEEVPPEPAASAEFNVIYSSGTTSAPKGIVHSHRTRLMRALVYGTLELGPQSGVLVSTPLYSNWTVVAMSLAIATSSAIILQSRFDARRFLETARAQRATHGFVVPTQIERCLALPEFDEACGDWPMTLFSSGSRLRSEVKREAIARWPGRLVEIYGLSEGALSTLFEVHEHPDKLDSVGRPAPGCVVRIHDDEDHALPHGTIGHIVGRSPSMMNGYLNRPAETAAIEFRDDAGERFFRTGDLGFLDEDGFLHLVGRAKEMIVSGGLNIYASDLEAALLVDPCVREAAVIAAPDDDWGETPVAFVSLADGAFGDAEAIMARANARLARTHRISRTVVVPALPRGTLDKVDKKALQAMVGKSGPAA
jgi:long-chain acyl-CoA synthetase